MFNFGGITKSLVVVCVTKFNPAVSVMFILTVSQSTNQHTGCICSYLRSVALKNYALPAMLEDDGHSFLKQQTLNLKYLNH